MVKVPHWVLNEFGDSFGSGHKADEFKRGWVKVPVRINFQKTIAILYPAWYILIPAKKDASLERAVEKKASKKSLH